MSVTEVKQTSFLDIPAKLRQLIEEIEKHGLKTVVVVIGYPDGKVAVRAYGERTSALMTTGWLARAQTVMTENCDAGTGSWVDHKPTPA